MQMTCIFRYLHFPTPANVQILLAFFFPRISHYLHFSALTSGNSLELAHAWKWLPLSHRDSSASVSKSERVAASFSYFRRSLSVQRMWKRRFRSVHCPSVASRTTACRAHMSNIINEFMEATNVCRHKCKTTSTRRQLSVIGQE